MRRTASASLTAPLSLGSFRVKPSISRSSRSADESRRCASFERGLVGECCVVVAIGTATLTPRVAGESELPLLIRFDARARPATGLRSVQCGYRVT